MFVTISYMDATGFPLECNSVVFHSHDQSQYMYFYALNTILDTMFECKCNNCTHVTHVRVFRISMNNGLREH